MKKSVLCRGILTINMDTDGQSEKKAFKEQWWNIYILIG